MAAVYALLLMCCTAVCEAMDMHVSARSNDIRFLESIDRSGNSWEPSNLMKMLNMKEDGTGYTPLMAATLANANASVKYLLEKRADPSIGDNDGYTPFHGAGWNGSAPAAWYLLKYRLDPSDRHTDGYTPLHRACKGNEVRHTTMVKFLLLSGVDPEEKSTDGKTCLDLTQNDKTKKKVKKHINMKKKKEEM